jgi:predicted DNA-binding transcriptional regulator
MRKAGYTSENQLEKTIREIIKSKAQSRIYLFLLRKNNGRAQDIIKGTHLHPSTVREALVQMHKNQLIRREKIRNDTIGKNPYIYSPLPPALLIKNYIQDMEHRLNNLVHLTGYKNRTKAPPSIRITITTKEEVQ